MSRRARRSSSGSESRTEASRAESRRVAARTILFLHSSAGRYGADRQLELLAGGLDRERYRALAVLAEDGPLVGELERCGVEVQVRSLAVLRRSLFSASGLARVGAALAADARALRHTIRVRDVELVHSNTSVTLGGAAAARLAGIPHVWHVREIYSGFERSWPAYRRLLARAAALPCVSDAVRSQFGPSAPARVIHDGVRAPFSPRPDRASARAALDLPADAFVCAVLGRISGWKGQDVLVRALAEESLRNAGALALVAGDAWPGEERHEAELHALAERLDVAGRVVMAGFLEDPGMAYAAADVVVVASTRPDPLPNTALEAGLAGCCVVASAHGGLPEIIRDGVTGQLFTPGDHAALARALAELAADPAKRARLGAAAADDIAARFSPEALLEKTQALYDELLGIGSSTA